MIHINQFMGALTFFFWEKRHINWPITTFFETLGTPPPIEAPLWTPSSKIEINMLSYGPPFSVSIDESWTWGKPYGIKLRCYWESLGEQLWNLGNLMGTGWEHIWEQENKQK
jgi:hypothetical protein